MDRFPIDELFSIWLGGGVIGPISALQLHPTIQHHLIGLEPQQLSSIFQLDDRSIFLRLDRSLAAQLTPPIERQLRDELFEEWLQKQILARLNAMSTDRVSNNHLPIADSVKQQQSDFDGDLQPRRIMSKHRRPVLVDRIAACCGFLGLFLAVEISAVCCFSLPLTPDPPLDRNSAAIGNWLSI
jgi:hypothetical protein